MQTGITTGTGPRASLAAHPTRDVHHPEGVLRNFLAFRRGISSFPADVPYRRTAAVGVVQRRATLTTSPERGACTM